MGKIFFEGFLLQASLIFALGAQNIFVIERGLRREHHLTVSLVCFLCDLTLIMLGVAGAATLFNQVPEFKAFIGILGVGFLFAYGIQRIFSKATFSLETMAGEKLSLKKSALLAATFSIINPHAYLDAFILIGGYATKFNELGDRLSLGLGAAIYSGIWFLLISSLAGIIRPFLKNQRSMRSVMTTAGLGLVFLSARLAGDVLSWMPRSFDYDFSAGVYHGGKNVILYSSILF